MPSENNTPAIRFAGFTGEWKQSELKNEAIVRTGFPFVSKDFSEDGEFLVITNGNIQDEFSEVDNRVGNRINVANNQLISQYALNIDDILVTMDGTVGRSAKVAHDKLILAQRVGRLTATREAEFLYQALNTGSFYESMTELSHGGTIKHISLSEIGQYKIAIPSDRQEEKQIGNLFQKLDTLITLLRRKCELLETLKKSMLEKLFPREGELVPELRFAGFTGEWERRKLQTFIEEITRVEPDSDAPIMMITANNGFIDQSSRYAFNNAGASLNKYILLKRGELAYNHGASKLRPYGSCFALVSEECARIPFVYHCFVAPENNPIFLSIQLNGRYVENQLRKIVSSGARMDGLLNITFEEYASVDVLLPQKEEQDIISSFFCQFDTLLTLHRRKLELLQNIKKACLEKMFV